jgi:hypothetical protein
MRHFCTLFDRNYIDRGLALHRSLLRHCPEFTLHVLCLDAATRLALGTLSPPKMRLIGIEELQAADPDLASCRTRQPAEFYFTCKPVLLRYLLAREQSVSRLDYLDADLYFFSDPAVAEQEYAGHPIALSPHRFDAPNAGRASMPVGSASTAARKQAASSTGGASAASNGAVLSSRTRALAIRSTLTRCPLSSRSPPPYRIPG